MGAVRIQSADKNITIIHYNLVHQVTSGVMLITCGFCDTAVWTLILTAPTHCRGPTGEKVMEC